MREQIEALVREALYSYRLHYTVEDDGGGLPLVDALTPASDETIARGQAEREALADYIAAHLTDRLAAIAQGVGEAGPKHGDFAEDGMRYVLCKVAFGDHWRDWLFIPHADGQYVSAAKLAPFSMAILRAALTPQQDTGGEK